MTIPNVGPSNGLLEQNEYFYWEERDRLRQVQWKAYELGKLLSGVAGLAQAPRERLEGATRWYGNSVTSTDALDGYIAAWIGLESTGPLLDRIYHLNGPKAACSLCGNTPGKNRDRKLAGIEHIIRLIAPEALQSLQLQNLANLRDEIVHALKPTGQLREVAIRLLPELQVSLAVGILTGAGRSGDSPISFMAWLPREYGIRPDARATVRFNFELTNYQSYFGEWIPLEREFVDERSRRESDGGYVWGAGVRLKANVTIEPGSPIPNIFSEYVMFQREGARWHAIGSGAPAVQAIPWRDHPIPPSWQRYRDRAATDSSES
jgi:hypothetical protein